MPSFISPRITIFLFSILLMGMGWSQEIDHSRKINQKLSRGVKAATNEFPWIVLLNVTNAENRTNYCAGTILQDSSLQNRWILTAAHCVKDFPDVVVLAGATNLYIHKSTGGQERRASAILIHENYTETSRLTLNDIALIKLESPFEVTESVKSIELTEPSPNDFTGNGSIAGWLAKPVEMNNFPLRKFSLSVTDTATCNQTYNGLITEQMICANGEGDTYCKVECGGPLICSSDDKAYLCGIVFSACNNRTAVFTRVQPYIAWIENIISNDSNSIATTENPSGSSISIENDSEVSTIITVYQSTNSFRDFPQSPNIAAITTEQPGTTTETVTGVTEETKTVDAMQSAPKDEFPWLVQLNLTTPKGDICAGILIKDQLVVTSGHCVNNGVSSIASVTAKELQGGKWVWSQTRISSKIILHENYTVSSKHVPLNDIALIMLNSPFDRRSNVPLDVVPEKLSNFTSVDLFVVASSTNRTAVKVDVTEADSREFVNNSDASQVIFVRRKNKDHCLTLSGNPLICRLEGSPYLCGIQSWQVGCASPGIYANISHYRDWIKINSANGSGPHLTFILTFFLVLICYN